MRSAVLCVSCLLLLMSIAIDCSIQSGEEVYVSPFGSDSTGDGSENNPFLTINHAVKSACNGSVMLLPGVFSGTSNYPTLNCDVSFVAVEGLGSVQIDGHDRSSDCFLLKSGCELFNLDSLVLENCDSIVALDNVPVFDINISNCHMQTSNYGIYTSGTSWFQGVGTLTIQDSILDQLSSGVETDLYTTPSLFLINSTISLSKNYAIYLDCIEQSVSTLSLVDSKITQSDIEVRESSSCFQFIADNLISDSKIILYYASKSSISNTVLTGATMQLTRCRSTTLTISSLMATQSSLEFHNSNGDMTNIMDSIIQSAKDPLVFSGSGDVTASNLTISSMSAGGVTMKNSASMTLRSSLFENNENPKGDGGGLFLNSGTSVNAYNVTFRNNAAENGGGVMCNNGSLSLQSSSFISNDATNEGGAYDCENDCQFFEFGNTFTDNQENTTAQC
mmetsp:Transcript_33867/g.46357  ORF Transcript_33867/g.46357 Transcript_33867/m.46357 type:complete len:448 (-) Transcript_33867:87-1430(-)